MSPAGWSRPPPAVLVGASALSVQLGAALATRLFSRVGPAGAVSLRLVLGAAVMALVVVGARRLTKRQTAVRQRSDMAVAAAFGVVMGAMNLAFYEAIARIPLGVAVTVEFSGPLAVALAGSRRRSDVLWAILAGLGVALLAGGVGSHLDTVGLVMALVAGACWAGYILLSRETGRRFAGPDGLAVALAVSALLVVPYGIAHAGWRLVSPGVLALGLAVAVVSSVLPYSLELIALRRVTPRAFGILVSLDPAVAALAGLLLLGQGLEAAELAALALVVAANLGSSLLGDRRQPTGTIDIVG